MSGSESEYSLFISLGAALAIGLLIGVERGWRGRDAEEGRRVAGVRTYALIGLLGGLTGILATHFDGHILSYGLLAMAAILLVAYVVAYRELHDFGITSLVAGVLTFALGALASLDYIALASAAGVATALVLGFKPELHHWLKTINRDELMALLKLLLITVVVLPVLPDRGYGPWAALNPYEIWWMVVMIAGISFAGYIAVKVAGTGRGILYTGLFAGLASSTALTLHYSRLARDDESLAKVLAAGVLIACGGMYLRVMLVASVLNLELLQGLIIPLSIMAVATLIPALVLIRRDVGAQPASMTVLQNPLLLKSAVGFGALLAVIMVLSAGLKHLWGDAGVLALAALSGIADVDAITLSLSRMSTENFPATVAATGIIIAVGVNSVAKGALAASIGGKAFGLRVGAPLVVSAVLGLSIVWGLR
jgi:uncharacterized membrane protein (DUF4010 family)